MKKLSLFLAFLLTFSLLFGCGAAETAAATADCAVEEVYMEAEAAAPAETAEAPAAMPEEEYGADGLVTGDISVDLSQKIIYTAYAEIETTEFEESLETVSKLLAQYEGFIESSSVTGSDLQSSYYGYSSYRTASYTLRIPRENYAAVTASLTAIGNVTYLTNDATNITTQYTDTESRLTAYKTEEARLLEILSKAETVEDMISVESRLSDIRYEMESLTSILTNWDNQVSYSTVSLYIQEVEIYTPTPVQELTYWEEVGQAVENTLHWMSNTGKSLLKFFIAALPILLPVFIILAVVLIIVKHRGKKKAQNIATAEPPQDK